MRESAARKVYLGWWGNEPIWRYETAAERLIEAIEEGLQNMKNKREKINEISN